MTRKMMRGNLNKRLIIYKIEYFDLLAILKDLLLK